jgi:CRISPR-associated endonuclease/helicase Cas3
MKDYYSFWGKARPENPTGPAYHLLAYHSLDVAAVGRVLLQRDQIIRPRLVAKTGLDESFLLSLVTFCLSLHDLGKFAESFQNIRPDLFTALRGRASSKDYTVRHDSLGNLLWLETIWRKGWEENWLRFGDGEMYDWQDVLYPWIQSVTGHHGVPPRVNFHGSRLSLDNHFDAEARAASITFTRQVAGFFLEECRQSLTWSDGLEEAFKHTSWILSGLAVLSDWVGSNALHFPYRVNVMPLSEYWTTYALPQAEAAVQASGVLPPQPSRQTGMRALFPEIEEPTPLQQYVSSCEIPSGPQLFILEEATGSGKTEAALTLAHRMMAAGLAQGIFMALPTMATANAMFERLECGYQRMYEGVGSPSLVLAHSKRHLSSRFQESLGLERQGRDQNYALDDESASARCVSWLADNRKKALLAAVGIGTVDQALLAVLPVRHQSLRLLGLGRSVLIVDEVHAYDPYMHTLLRNLLSFHAAQGGSAILLSATLPRNTRQDLANSFKNGLGGSPSSIQKIDYPLATHVSCTATAEVPIESSQSTARTVAVEMAHEEKAVEDRLRLAARDGECACWIRNTVDDAVTAYRRLAQDLDEGQVILFHARFAMGDRLGIETKVLRLFGKDSKPEVRAGKILIATQVVEQSLDLDFDFMVSDLAPVDLVIQRAGRLHRHQRGERGKPTLMVLAPPLIDTPEPNWYAQLFPRGAYVYPSHGQLWLTARLLADRGQMKMPDDARHFVEAVFGEEQQDGIPKELRGRDRDADGKARAAISLAQLNGLDLAAGYTPTLNQWLEDTVTPTRLGVPTTTVRLARWDRATLTPWFSSDRFAWDLSQVSVNRARIAGPSEHDRGLQVEVDRAMESMPDHCKWSVLVPLSPVEDGIWQGRAVDHRQRQVTAIYHPKTGLRVVREGETESSS